MELLFFKFLVYWFHQFEMHAICHVSQPLWVLKSANEKYVQRLVHISADLARQVGMMLENLPDNNGSEVNFYIYF